MLKLKCRHRDVHVFARCVQTRTCVRSLCAGTYMCSLVVCRQALEKIQRNLRKWLQTKDWEWAKLFTTIRPQLQSVNMEAEMRKKQEAYEKTKAQCDIAVKEFKALEVSLMS